MNEKEEEKETEDSPLEKEEEMGEMMKINSPIELENRMKKRMEECGCMPMCGKEEDL